MELDITRFFTEACPMDYSASQAELGKDAGKITWNHAVEDAADYDLLSNDVARDAFRDYVKDFGAWEDSEIAAWSNDELNALCMQMIAGDIREVPGMEPGNWDWEEYNRLAERGTCGGSLYQGDDGRVYYYIGS